jgi:hypothetical protein
VPRTASLNFTATLYSAEILEKAAHPRDLVEGDRALLRLDAAVNGVGTAVVGPGNRKDQLVKLTEARAALGTVQRLSLTALLALWYLCMLASDDNAWYLN